MTTGEPKESHTNCSMERTNTHIRKHLWETYENSNIYHKATYLGEKNQWIIMIILVCIPTCQRHDFLKDLPSLVLVCQLVLKNTPVLEVEVLYPFETWEEAPLLGHPVHFLL